ncbi:MAG: hypothetical protein HRT45_11715 [Bdellovibrionales bacterium]|nr:hypothetical protein [Bdellovibrionales bacterium]
MKTKKAKDLALELMDDLLGSKEDSDQAQGSKGKVKSASAGDSDHDIDLDLGIDVESSSGQDSVPSIDLDASNPFLVQDSDVVEPPPQPDPTQVANPTRTEVIADQPPQTPAHTTTNVAGADKTIKLSESKIISHPSMENIPSPPSAESQQAKPPVHQPAKPVLSAADIRSSASRASGMGGASSPAQVSLIQSENLRVAQQRILELEEEISRLRTDNEALAAAGETLKNVSDQSKSSLETLQRRMSEQAQNSKQEKSHLEQVVKSKQNQIDELEQKVSQMDMRLSSSIQKIRVRERELENRLELVKMENQALIRSKDEMILDLKRQIDQITIEIESYRNKGQELNQQLGQKQETLSRTVKALRLALSLLEGSDPSGDPSKKVS